MKKVTLTLVLVLSAVMLCAGISTAEDFKNGGPYVTVKGGAGFLSGGDLGIDDNATNGTGNDGSDWDKTTAFLVGAAFGYDFVDAGVPMRAELEYLYHGGYEYDFDGYDANGTKFSDQIDIHTIFANVYYDIYTGTRFTPYIGAGIGMAILSEDRSSEGFSVEYGDTTKTNFAWNVGAGTAIALTDMFVLDLGYRYTHFGKTKDIDDVDLKVDGQEIGEHSGMLGIRINF